MTRVVPTEQRDELCRFILEFRLKHDLTVSALAQLLHVSPRSIQMWERSKHPPAGQRLVRLRRLVEAYENMDMRDRKTAPSKLGKLRTPAIRDYWERRMKSRIEQLKATEAQQNGRTNS